MISVGRFVIAAAHFHCNLYCHPSAQAIRHVHAAVAAARVRVGAIDFRRAKRADR